MTSVKIYTCILANIPGRHNRQIKKPRSLTQDSDHGKLVQLVFVSHMQYMAKFVAFPLLVSINESVIHVCNLSMFESSGRDYQDCHCTVV